MKEILIPSFLPDTSQAVRVSLMSRKDDSKDRKLEDELRERKLLKAEEVRKRKAESLTKMLWNRQKANLQKRVGHAKARYEKAMLDLEEFLNA